MKNKFSIFILIISLLSSIFILLQIDQNQQKEYFLLDTASYNYSIDIPIQTDNLDIINQNISVLQNIAIKNNIKILIPYFDYEKNSRIFFFSSNMETDIQNNFNLLNDSLPYITYGNNANIKDILNNDRFEYNSIDNLIKNEKIYWSGEIYLKFNNTKEYEQFIESVSSHFDIPKNKLYLSYSQFRITGQLTRILLAFGMTVFFISYVMGIIQNINANSKHIGVYLLLGFDNKKIISKIAFIDILSVCLSFLFSIFGFIILPNIPIYFIFIALIKDIGIVIILILLYYFLLNKIIQKNYSLILKKQHVTSNLNKFNTGLQLLICISLMVLSLFISNAINETFNYIKEKEKYKYLLDYGVIGYFDANYLTNQNFEKTEKMLLTIANNVILKDKYMYVDFSPYKVLSPDAKVQPGYKFDNLFATVSSNYFLKEKIIIYDKTGNKVELDETYQSDIFIFPKSYDKDKEIVLNYYYDNSKDFYVDENISPEILYYDNQIVRTYDLNIANVDSPVFRIIRVDDTRNYINDAEGVSLYATGMGTGLKFDISSGKEEILKELTNYFNDISLENEFIPDDQFFSYADYFNKLLSREKNALTLTCSAYIILMILFVFVIVQFVYLYHIENKREIAVRKFLGHSFFKIYREIFFVNFMIFFISLIAAIMINLFKNIGVLWIFAVFSVVFMLVNILIVFMISYNKYKLNTIKDLKGGTIW